MVRGHALSPTRLQLQPILNAPDQAADDGRRRVAVKAGLIKVGEQHGGEVGWSEEHGGRRDANAGAHDAPRPYHPSGSIWNLPGGTRDHELFPPNL